MKEGLAFIAVVLDRSSSMNSVLDNTIMGFNEFLGEQRKQPGETLFTLAAFSSGYDDVNGYSLLADAVPLADVPFLTRETYTPNGGTALLDAIGKTIDSVGAKLAALPESDRPSKVLIMIQTDGEENSSRQYSRARIAEMIKHQREKYGWDFVFVGATEEALAEAESYGFAVMDSMQYSATPAGTSEIMRNLSVQTSRYRGEEKTSGVRRGFFQP